MQVNYRLLGEKVKVVRKIRNLSIEDLGLYISYSAKSVILIESGQAVIGIELLLKLCTALDVSPNELLAGQYKISAPIVPAEPMLEITPEADSPKEKTVIRDDETTAQKIREMLAGYKKTNVNNK